MSPYLELIIELGHNEESSPTPQLLGLEHISKDVVADIQYIPEEAKVNNAKKGCTYLQNKGAPPALGSNKLGENLRTASTVHSRVLQSPSVGPNAQPSRFFVHLKKKYLNHF